MALKGQIAKREVIDKILAAFPGSFEYDKEIRIPWAENGEFVQIKCTLAAAKTPVELGGDIELPSAAVSVQETRPATEAEYIEPSAEEKENLKKLLKGLF